MQEDGLGLTVQKAFKARKIMKRHPFINTNLIQTLEEEIKLLEQGKSNVEQSKSVLKVAQRLISLKMLEIQEEEKVTRELIRKINEYKS